MDREKYYKAAQIGADFITTGMGEFSLKNAFKEICDEIIANNDTNTESVIGHRQLLADKIIIDSIRFLSWEDQERLKTYLYKLAGNQG